MLAGQGLLAWTAAGREAGSPPLGCLGRTQYTEQHAPQPLQHCENLLALSVLQRKGAKLFKHIRISRVSKPRHSMHDINFYIMSTCRLTLELVLTFSVNAQIA